MSDLETKLLKLSEEWWPISDNCTGWDDLARGFALEAARLGAEDMKAKIAAYLHDVRGFGCTEAAERIERGDRRFAYFIESYDPTPNPTGLCSGFVCARGGACPRCGGL